MSYDVSFVIKDSFGEGYTVDSFNYTSNLAPVWREAGALVHEWDGSRAVDRLLELDAAIAVIKTNLLVFEKMNPENGWGDVKGMLKHFLKPMADRMRRWPNSTIKVWR